MKPPERWIAIAGVAVLSVIAVAGFALAIYSAWLFHDMPDASELADYHPPTATRVYAWDGTLIGEFSRERRIFVPYDQIPKQLSDAFLAAEDHDFFKHGGLDPLGLARAMGKDLLNAARGRRLEGGSTITQQVAKNVLLSNEATMGRKLKEAILANRLEKTLTKEHILELYLNEIWLGYRSYGVGAAAYNYFGKPLSDLDLAECAYLAALPKGPDNYQPVKNKAAAIARRNWILGQMVAFHTATKADAEKAMKEDLKVQLAPTRAKYRDADYFVEEVRERALITLGPRLSEGGYYMRTTLDPRLQTAARVALMHGLENYDHRHGWRGAWGHADPTKDWQKAALAQSPPSERRAWRAAVVESDVRRCACETGRRVRVGRPGRRRRRLGQGERQGAARRRSGLCRAGLGRPLQPASGSHRQWRPGGHRSAQRPHPGDGGRLQLLAVEVQPRDPGDAAARVVVQTLRLRHGPGERLHAGQRGGRTGPSPCRAPRRARSGRRRITTRASLAPSRCAGGWSSRSTP